MKIWDEEDKERAYKLVERQSKAIIKLQIKLLLSEAREKRAIKLHEDLSAELVALRNSIGGVKNENNNDQTKRQDEEIHTRAITSFA